MKRYLFNQMGRFKIKKFAKLAKKAIPFVAGLASGAGITAVAMKAAISGASRLASKKASPGHDSDLRPQTQTSFEPSSLSGPAIAASSGCGASGGDLHVMIPTAIFIFIMYMSFRYYIKRRKINV